MKKTSESERGIFLPSFKSQIAWIVSGVVLLVIFCAVAYSTEDPDAMMKPLALTALYLSAAIGGVFAARLSGGRMICGLLSGGFTALIVFALSVIPIFDSGITIGEGLIMNALIIPASFIGSFIGTPRSKKPKKHPSRMKKIHR